MIIKIGVYYSTKCASILIRWPLVMYGSGEKHKFACTVPETWRNQRAPNAGIAGARARYAESLSGKEATSSESVRLRSAWWQETQRCRSALQAALRAATVTGRSSRDHSRVTQSLIRHPILRVRFNRAAAACLLSASLQLFVKSFHAKWPNSLRNPRRH